MGTLIRSSLAFLMMTAIPIAAAEHGGTPPPAPAPSPGPRDVPDIGAAGGGYTGEMHADTPSVSPPTRDSDPEVATTPATAPAPVPSQTQTGGGKPASEKGKN